MRLQWLSASVDHIFGKGPSTDMTHPAFAHITHLDMYDDFGETRVRQATKRGIPALPSLTHLCLNEDVPWDVMQALLEECPQLKLLANFWSAPSETGHEHAQNVPFRDVRFVMGSYTDYWGDWLAGAKGLTCFWDLADEFIARKRRGEIKGSVTLLIYPCHSQPKMCLEDSYWCEA
jgi:hypothetical protein